MGTHLKQPLPAGAPLRYWQVSAVLEERFDVDDTPMEGEMDPFFFLTKHKNFIPHEYPCRRVFGETYRGKRPDVRGAFSPDRNWLPFGSPRLDLSGFWYRPTRLAAWARTAIDAERAGEAVLRLAVCGGAVLWVNGEEIGWTAPYSRNLAAAAAFTTALREGLNEVLVFFDDLAERDARYFLQAEYVSGPRAEEALAVPCDAAVAAAVEDALEHIRLDRAFYTDGEVTLRLARAAAFDMEAAVSIEGDFISFHRERAGGVIAAGGDRLVLGGARAIAAGYRHFHVTLSAGGFSATRTLGAEICPAGGREAPHAPPDRAREALDHFAECPEKDAVCAFARLASGRGGAETDRVIESVLPAIEDCHDCADFSLVPLLWARIAWGSAIGSAARERLDNAILGYRYWMDEPGNDVQWYFSENHALLFHTAAHLAGHLFPDRRFVRSGRTGAEQSRAGTERLRAWFDHFAQWEMAEFNSAPYFPIDLKGLTALAALSPDAGLAARARAGILRLTEILARSAHRGVLTAAQGRSYEHTLCAGRTLELSGLSRLLWGQGEYGGQASVLPLYAVCLRDHGLAVPPELGAIACHEGPEQREWLFAQGANRMAKLYHCKSRHFAMGSAVRYRWNEWGYQETPLHLRIGDRPEASVWINHPGEIIQFGYARPSYWGGCGTLPRAHQYRGLAFLEFAAAEEQPAFTHAWFPQREFDAARVSGDTAFAVCGGGGVVLRGASALLPAESGPSAGCELRQNGRNTRWIVRVFDRADAEDTGGRFARLSAETEADGTVAVDDPEYGRVLFRADGTVEAEGRVIAPDDFTVRGAANSIAP